jgi:hypothetical protein
MKASASRSESSAPSLKIEIRIPLGLLGYKHRPPGHGPQGQIEVPGAAWTAMGWARARRV